MNAPSFYILCGIPGAGKSHARKTFLPDLPVVDCDEIKRSLPGYDPTNLGLVHEESSKLSVREVYSRIGAGQSFIYDSTGTNVEKLSRMIDAAHMAGFGAVLIYVTAPLSLCIKRNQTRDRHVSEAVIWEKAAVIEAVVSQLRRIADRTVIIDTSGDEPTIVEGELP